MTVLRYQEGAIKSLSELRELTADGNRVLHVVVPFSIDERKIPKSVSKAIIRKVRGPIQFMLRDDNNRSSLYFENEGGSWWVYGEDVAFPYTSANFVAFLFPGYFHAFAYQHKWYGLDCLAEHQK